MINYLNLKCQIKKKKFIDKITFTKEELSSTNIIFIIINSTLKLRSHNITHLLLITINLLLLYIPLDLIYYVRLTVGCLKFIFLGVMIRYGK